MGMKHNIHQTPQALAAASPHARREHKDRLFCDLFSDKKNALSLFNAINGTDYTDIDALEIVTLKDVIYLTMHNDLAVCFHSLLGLFEQQSTINPNMPLRGLLYFAREYEGWLAAHEKDIYSKTLIKIPTPQYYILYNGTEKAAERITYRLSDAFSVPTEGYEWTAHMLNINPGCNPELLAQCEPLRGYVTLISLIRQEQAEGKQLTEAVREAIDTCIRQGILRDYLIKHEAEVTAMILTEYNEKLREKTLHEEGLEQGREEGREEGYLQMALNAVRHLMSGMDMSAEDAMNFLEFSEAEKEKCRKLL